MYPNKRSEEQVRRESWEIYHKAMELSGCTKQNGLIRDEWKGKPDLMMLSMLIEAVENLTEHIDRANRK